MLIIQGFYEYYFNYWKFRVFYILLFNLHLAVCLVELLEHQILVHYLNVVTSGFKKQLLH